MGARVRGVGGGGRKLPAGEHGLRRGHLLRGRGRGRGGGGVSGRVGATLGF